MNFDIEREWFERKAAQEAGLVISGKYREGNARLTAELLECLKDARRLLTDQDAIDLVHIDEVIAKAGGDAR